MTDVNVQSIIVWIITYVGIPVLAVKIFDWLQRPDTPTQIQNMPYGAKRVAAIVLAAIIMGVVWFVGTQIGAYPKPVGDFIVWLNAYLAVVWPVAVVDQVFHGFFSLSAEKSREAKLKAENTPAPQI